MNAKDIARMKLILIVTLSIAMISSLYGGIAEWSVQELIHWCSLVVAMNVVIHKELVQLGGVIYQAFADIGEAVVSFAVATYKFVLRPLMRDYRAKENNYKEIIKGLQKELSRGNEH